MAEAPSALFRLGRLYAWHTRRTVLLRLIAESADGEDLLFKIVHLKWSSVPTKVLSWKRSIALQRMQDEKLQEIEEQVRHAYMSRSDEDLERNFQASRRGVDLDQNRAWLGKRDADFQLIESLVSGEMLFSSFSPDLQAFTLTEHVRKTSGIDRRNVVEEQKLRRLLHRYAWFGMDKNSLLGLLHQRGTNDILVRTYTKKTGAPGTLVKLGGSEKFAGRNITKRDLKLFIEALQRWYVGMDMSYQRTYDLMVEHLYVQRTVTPQGEGVVYPIGRHAIPTFFAFRKRAVELVKQIGLAKCKAGRVDGKETVPRRGHDADIAPRYGDVFCMDATVFNKESVLEVELDGEQKNVGKHSYVVVRDRATGDPRGWHLYTGAETWDEGYRCALLCALTSKRRHLEYLGIHDPDAWPDDENIAPLAMVFDGGPAAGNDAEAAFSRLGIRSRPAAPANAQQKGGVEALIGRSQNAQSYDAGAYRRTGRARDREMKRQAKLRASEDHYAIEKKLAESLIRERRARNKQHLWTLEMKKDGCQPTAADLVRWSVGKMGGVHMRRLSEADAYLSLLTHKKCGVSPNGVRLLGATYQSLRLAALRRVNSGRLTVVVLYNPVRPNEALWCTPEGQLDNLHREKRGDLLHGHLTAAEIAMVELRSRASHIMKEDKENKKKSKARGGLTVEQHRILLENASRVPTNQRTVVTKEVPKMRQLQHDLQVLHRPYDSEATHLPGFAAARAQMPSGVMTLPGAKTHRGQDGPSNKQHQPSVPNDTPPQPTATAAPRPSSSRRVSSAALWGERLQDSDESNG